MSKSLSLVTSLAAVGLAVAVPACGVNDEPGKRSDTSAPAKAAIEKPTERGTVRFIRLPEWKPTLPAGEARDLVMVQCAMCHTPEYITLQPPLSRDAWTASVTKMRTTYGGPIPEEQVPKIVDYLVAINGAK